MAPLHRRLIPRAARVEERRETPDKALGALHPLIATETLNLLTALCFAIEKQARLPHKVPVSGQSVLPLALSTALYV